MVEKSKVLEDAKMVEKSKVLEDAKMVLNNESQPFEVNIEGDSIVAKWKWMDAGFFGIGVITDEIKEFTFQVILDDKGKWHEVDSSKSKKSKFHIKGMSFETSTFKGTSMNKSFTIGFGKNKQTDETGIVQFQFDTKLIKEPIRNYLKNCGWKKAGLFS